MNGHSEPGWPNRFVPNPFLEDDSMSILTLLGFKKAVETARAKPTVPRLIARLHGDKVREDASPARVDGAAFEPGRSYFSLRLAGLHLRDARRFTTERLPLCICLTEFQMAGRPQTVPFALGPDTIRQKLTTAGAPTDRGAAPQSGWVELRDIEIVPPTPVSRDNVEGFIGLYSVPGDDVARTLLNVLGTVSQAVGGALSPALGIAEKVYEGFNTLLGVKDVTPEVEALLGNLLRHSGYLLVSNLPENAPGQEKLHVVNGRLRRGADRTAPLVVEFDYCLLAVERHETVVEATGTAPDLFGPLWTEVVDAFDAGGDAPSLAYRRLQRSIYGSPKLIPRDRDVLLAGYLVEYRNLELVLGTTARGPESRGRIELAQGIDALVTQISISGNYPALYKALTKAAAPGLPEAEARTEAHDTSRPIARALALRDAVAAREPGELSDLILRTL